MHDIGQIARLAEQIVDPDGRGGGCASHVRIVQDKDETLHPSAALNLQESAEEDAKMKVQVCIIGGGPSGLLLSQLLHLKGIDTVVLEKYSHDRMLARVRAGGLGHGFARLRRAAPCGQGK